MNKREFNKMLAKYADVIVRVGLTIREGQRLIIYSGILNYSLVRLVVSSAYAAGARYVDVIWHDEETNHIHLKNAPLEAIGETTNWLTGGIEEFITNGDAYLGIGSANPDIFSDVDPERLAIFRKAWAQKAETISQLTSRDAINWSIAAMPSADWAQKIFPRTTSKRAIDQLWEAIFQSCRVDQPDPIAAWETHIAELLKRSEYLNTKKYTAVHYKAPNTDLTVGLPEKHKWISARMKAENGVEFIANLPTEEVFTMPHKDKVNGRVSSSRPFVLTGSIVDDFTVTFENGKITNVVAKKGEKNIRKLLEVDEGASRIGEIALVPYSSPISQRGHLFYNLLFDENAASHIAIGNAYRFTMNGGDKMTDEEFKANGGNVSLIHYDFMIGSAEMDIDGVTANGTKEPVMRQGEWAFDI